MFRSSPILHFGLIGMLLGAGPGFAQSNPSSLAAKTIHIYPPVPGERLFVVVSDLGYPMAPVPGTPWMTCTLPDTLPATATAFGIRLASESGQHWVGPDWLDPLAVQLFTLDYFRGRDTLWIVLDPAGPVGAPPFFLMEAPKVVHVLNPWPATAPVLAFSDGVRKGMLTVPDKCGWFWAFLLDSTRQSFHLEDVNGTDAFGSAGMGSRLPYALAPEFAAKGSSLWLDTDFNSWLGAEPGKNQPCGYMLAATVRDFSASHPDFEFENVTGVNPSFGMVQSTLGPDRKPVRSAKVSPLFNRFEEWFTTTPGVNAETCVDIPMIKTSDGMWQYDSYLTPEHGFWPIDDFNAYNGAPNTHNEKTRASCYVKPDGTSWVTNGRPHNMNFCMESHATFVYRRGQKFEFQGDDDIWVYIDGILVVDLGGVHTPMTVVVDLDQAGLVAGQTYKWDFFSCDRQPCASNLRIKTSIYFKQQQAISAEEITGKPGAYKIIKYLGGNGSCGSAGDTVLQVPVTTLAYKLRSSGGVEIESLEEGSFHGGGIVIATPNVTLDTSKIRDLPPGNYRIIAYEPANAKVVVEIPFTVTGSSSIRARLGKPDKSPTRSPRHDALGRKRFSRRPFLKSP